MSGEPPTAAQKRTFPEVADGPIADIAQGRSKNDGISFSPYEGPPQTSASSGVNHLSLRNRGTRCLGRQTFCGRFPAFRPQPCEILAQMRQRRCSRGLGQSLSARVLLPPGARALAQCEYAENTRLGSYPLHLQTAVAAFGVPVRPPSPGPQGKLIVSISFSPAGEPVEPGRSAVLTFSYSIQRAQASAFGHVQVHNCPAPLKPAP